jgi:hypothetical protein
MVRNIHGKPLMLGPRDKGLAFTTSIKKLHTISVDETIQVDGLSVTGIKATHGPLTFKFGPFSKTVRPGPEERNKKRGQEPNAPEKLTGISLIELKKTLKTNIIYGDMTGV